MYTHACSRSPRLPPACCTAASERHSII
jgi:DNA-binding MarR family transcriptional regulator